MTADLISKINAAAKRFIKRALASPRTSGAALATAYGALQTLYRKPELLQDPAFMGGLLVTVGTVYGLLSASDSKHKDEHGNDADK